MEVLERIRIWFDSLSPIGKAFAVFGMLIISLAVLYFAGVQITGIMKAGAIVPEYAVISEISGDVISLQEVKVLSSSKFFSDKTWLSTVIIRNTKEEANPDETFNKDELSSGKYVSDSDLFISFKINEAKCVMPTNYYGSVYKYEVSKVTQTLDVGKYAEQDTVCQAQLISQGRYAYAPRGDECIIYPPLPDSCVDEYYKACEEKGGIVAKCGPGNLYWTCAKIDSKTIGSIRTQTGEYEYHTKFDIITKTKSGTETISLEVPGKTSGKSSNVASEFIEYSTTGRPSCPTQGALIFYDKRSNSYSIIDEDNLFATDGAVSKIYNWRKILGDQPAFTHIEATVSKINEDIENSLKKSPTDPAFGGTRYVEGTNIVVDTINNIRFYPKVRLFIRAKWLGLYIPVPVASIGDITVPTEIKQNSEDLVYVEITNTGETGEICTYVSCEGGISVYGGEKCFTFNSGETKKLMFTLHVAKPPEGKYTCTVYATPELGEQVTKQFSLIVTKECDITCKGDSTLDRRSCSCICLKKPEDAPEGYVLDVDPTSDTYCRFIEEEKEKVPTEKPTITQCNDGTKVGECSKVNEGFYCDPSGALIESKEKCGKEGETCSENEIYSEEENKCVCAPGFARDPSTNECKKVCTLLTHEVEGKCETDWMQVGIVVVVLLGIAGGIYYYYHYYQR